MLVKLARNALTLMPERAGYALTRALAAATQRPAMGAVEKQAMASARRIRYGARGENAAWAWGEGAVVVLVHGWSGRAAQMAPLAATIAAAGFRAVALDVTGHGASPGRRTSWSDFLRDIPALATECGGEVHACIGHSAGGLAMMAARRAGALSARKYVCICAPSYPFPPIEVVTRKLAPGPAILEQYKSHIAVQFGSTWQELRDGLAFEGAGPETLLIYDRADRFVAHTEGDRIAALAHGARLVKTAAYGHLRVLGSPEVFEKVRRFLAGNEA